MHILKRFSHEVTRSILGTWDDGLEMSTTKTRGLHKFPVSFIYSKCIFLPWLCDTFWRIPVGCFEQKPQGSGGRLGRSCWSFSKQARMDQGTLKILVAGCPTRNGHPPKGSAFSTRVTKNWA